MTSAQENPLPSTDCQPFDDNQQSTAELCPRCGVVVERRDSGEEVGFDPAPTDTLVFVQHSRPDKRDGKDFLLRCPGSGKNPSAAAEGF
jgi:hypothetical protein